MLSLYDDHHRFYLNSNASLLKILIENKLFSIFTIANLNLIIHSYAIKKKFEFAHDHRQLVNVTMHFGMVIQKCLNIVQLTKSKHEII